MTGFINIMYPSEGFWSFVIFYATYAISNLIAPFLIIKFPFRLIFFLSAFTFLIMIGFTSSYISALFLVGSAICGFGNGFIWLIQGTYLSSNFNDKMGLFYSLFNINMIFGNVVGLIVLLTGASIQLMLFVMLGLSSVGVFLTIFFKDISSTSLPYPTADKKFFTEISKVFLISKKCYLIILCMVYSSIGLNITYQILPRLLILTNTGGLDSTGGLNTGGLNTGSTQTKAIYNAGIYIVYGISAMIFSIIWSKLFLKNPKWVLYPYTILEILCLIGILLLAKFNTTLGYWIIFGAVRGCIDYGINNLINMSLSSYSSEDISYLFALYRMIYSISYLITAICVGYLPYEYVLLICGIFCIASTISYSFFVVPLPPSPSIETQFNNTSITV